MLSPKIFKQLLSQTEVGFCMITKESLIVDTNDAFLEYAKQKTPLGEKLSDILISDSDYNAFVEETLSKGSSSLEVSFNPTTEPFFAIANATKLKGDKDQEYIALLFTGFNKQKMLETELEERIAFEVESNRKKDEIMNQQAKLATMGEMIGNIAHQWRQPLNILALVFQDIYIKFQLKALDSEQMEKNYEKVNNLIQYMSQTIDDFRTFFKSEDGDRAFNVGAAVNSVFDLVGTRFSTSNTECVIDIKDSVSVMGTENGFKQVLINLLNNAQEAILSIKPSSGNIHVNVQKKSDTIVVMVSDNGGGVPAAIINQIFEPYFTTKHQTQGTGLGLYMSKKIIEHHMAGKLEVNNNKEGAVFEITLPIA